VYGLLEDGEIPPKHAGVKTLYCYVYWMCICWVQKWEVYTVKNIDNIKFCKTKRYDF